MFSTGSLEKNSSTIAEPHSLGRSKYPVGLNSVGDESQQNNRIQSAVHRYNNSTVDAFTRTASERSIPSPFRHAFLKNVQKYKDFETDKEEAQNGLKKSYNYYQGVGNFPVVHLRKSEIITRPIKRIMSNEFKIQLPELPFNRFLNNSPDICLDAKTSTRSVLDVLQDLSRKRIHTKDDTEVTKGKCKGLGGDAPMDIEAPFKPLFVPKTKATAVTLRDSTTQTQDLPQLELSPVKKKDNIMINKRDDPRAELRRKLARQNNEIFASLSSSTLMYPLKRNSGKLSHEKDETKPDEQNAKRVKYFLEKKIDKKLQNGDISSKDLQATSNGDRTPSQKPEKRNKSLVDSKLSPNKDRLTTIFLEMQNINPVMEVLTNNHSVTRTDGVQPAQTLNGDKSSEEKSMSSENKNVNVEKSGNISVGGSPASVSVMASTLKSGDMNKIPKCFNNADKGNKDISVTDKNNLSTCVITSGFNISTASTMSFGISSTNPVLKLPIASTVSSSLIHTPIFSTGVSQNENTNSDGISSSNKIVENSKSDAIVSNEENSPNQKLSFQPSSSGSGLSLSQGISEQSTGAGMFKFGTGVNASPIQIAQSEQKTTLEPTKEGEDNGVSVINPTSISLNLFSSSNSSQSPLVANPATTSTISPNNQQNTQGFSFPGKLSSITSESGEKRTFPFAFNPPTTSGSLPSSLVNTGMPEAKPEDKPEQKTESKDTPKLESNNVNASTPSFPPSNFQNSLFTASVPTFGQPAVTSGQNVMPFKFGEKTETKKPIGETPPSGNNFFDQKKTGVFAFGQKPSVSVSNSSNEPSTSQPNLFQQSTFAFCQNSSSPAAAASQTSTSSNIFGQTTSPQKNIFQPTGTTANPLVNTVSPFGATSQASDSLNKAQVSSFIPTTSTTTGIMNNTFTQNKQSVPAFGQATSTNFSGEKIIFGNANSTQATPAFGGASAGQPGPFSSTFGDSNKQQDTTIPTSGFFSQTPTTQTSTFPSSTGFRTSAFGQTPSTENNIFGQKTGFEQNQSQPAPFSTAQPFTSQAGFNFGGTTTTPAPTGFGMSSPNTSTPVFGFGSSTKTTPSTFGFTATAQPEAPSQSLFSFNYQSQQNSFKFGNEAAKEPTAFGSTGSASSAFSFNATPATSEAPKPGGSVFNFGSTITTSASTGFNFGASQSPVFSFGSSSSSSNSSKFTFGASSAGGVFTPGTNPSPSTVPLQGVFSIGSGSSQPRNRSSMARARRRP